MKKGEEFAILTNIISYVVSEDTREVVDITTLNAKIAKIVTRQNELRTAIDEIVVDIKSK
ncbi:MAG: hypothetical protein Q8P72_00960 [Candidatus Roizmanbacteria bacterium]|nr:hypothetical protein [Candidatus Roizmanbacteria bacterium]